jgi:flagellar hook-associated protein 1 FlgK
MSITSILNIARTALSAAQVQIETTSHNIANVNTKGYSRQEAVLEEATPRPSYIGLVGNGVTVKQIRSYYDQSLHNAICSRNSNLEEQKVYKQYLTRIEGVLNEDNSQLSKSITDFFNAWQALSADPTSTAEKQTVAMEGKNLSTVVNGLYSGLKDLQTDLNGNVNTTIDDINTITTSIASLNKLISQSQSGTSVANDYIDQRNQLLKELAGKLNINYFAAENDQMTVLTASGKLLVQGSNSLQLVEYQNASTGFIDVGWKDSSGNVTDITDQVNGGSLGALIAMRDTTVNQYIADLDTLAESIIKNVNDLHIQGNGNAGFTFFKPLTENYAKDMKLSGDIEDSSGNIKLDHIMVTSSTENASDNDIALEIASLAGKTLLAGATYSGYASAVVAKVGQAVKSASNLTDYNQSAMTSLEQQRAEISGVSIDEEMANLIKFQNAYQAAARLYTVADEMLKTLVNAV